MLAAILTGLLGVARECAGVFLTTWATIQSPAAPGRRKQLLAMFAFGSPRLVASDPPFLAACGTKLGQGVLPDERFAAIHAGRLGIHTLPAAFHRFLAVKGLSARSLTKI